MWRILHFLLYKKKHLILCTTLEGNLALVLKYKIKTNSIIICVTFWT